jgi:Subtilase family
MSEKPRDRLPHIVARNKSNSIAYTAKGGGRVKNKIHSVDRVTHGALLQSQLAKLAILATESANAQRADGLKSGIGFQIQFASFAKVELPFESLSNESNKNIFQQIELLSVRAVGDKTVANVFVPDGKLEHFDKYVLEYLNEKRDKNNVVIDNAKLLTTIETIEPIELKKLWTDDPDLLPQDPAIEFWWEVWLPVRNHRELVVSEFRRSVKELGCRVGNQQINFPERTVVLMFGSEKQLSTNSMVLNSIAELRKAKETADFFDSLSPLEQLDWVIELKSRIVLPPDNDGTPRVCLLDTGVNRGHPLLASLMTSQDLHTVDPNWGVTDNNGHGTGLAGLAAFGDLTAALASTDKIDVSIRLESVKLFGNSGNNTGDAELFGSLFAEAVSRPEIDAPNRSRVFTSAVTSTDGRDRGRPSAWSAKVDGLASDDFNKGNTSRLIVLCAGNTRNPSDWNLYPASLATNQLHDPAQAWNALTVGAYTAKTKITEADAQHYVPIAAAESLSPFTTTSVTWANHWPLKPEVVFEGGNAGKDTFGAAEIASLSLLTTNYRPQQRNFATTNATSAASALCAGMAAQLMAQYPSLRPETIRALIVQSANWTAAMRAAHLPPTPNKSHYVHLIRHCGWGVPDLTRATWSAQNSLTLIVEDELVPFKKQDVIKTNQMRLHQLPWPKNFLQELPANTIVEMRVTLSYFIEPNPSSRGEKSKFHYPSHRLRFAVKRPLEPSETEFIARINKATELEEDQVQTDDSSDSNWLLGPTQRYRGSLHQDVWIGTAAELANRGFIAVYPAAGWWKTRQALSRYDSKAKYSLLVSIATPNTEVDLYTAIENVLAVPVETSFE